CGDDGPSRAGQGRRRSERSTVSFGGAATPGFDRWSTCGVPPRHLVRWARAAPATPEVQRIFLSSCNSSSFTALIALTAAERQRMNAGAIRTAICMGKTASHRAKVMHPSAKHGAALLPFVISKEAGSDVDTRLLIFWLRGPYEEVFQYPVS